MKKKYALITGSGRGIGARTAEVLAENGFGTALCARTQRELSETTERISGQYGTPVLGLVCDVSDDSAVKEMVGKAQDWADGVDVLVNCAGIAGPLALFEDADPDEWRNVFDINFFGTVHCARAILPAMKKQGHGKIINFTGGGAGGKHHPERQTAYVTSKVAVCGFTETLATEVEGDNIQVNALSPGPVETKIWDNVLTAEERRDLKAKEADLSPEAAAQLVAFLASERSGKLTGKVLSARWDTPDGLARDINGLNKSCRNTLRRIDGNNYHAQKDT
ncbi:MAG: SDR family oxidoreductase [Rhodospirillales bacterium]|nr:SDR family oxidoreductase [Rhodospirillales bacterium]